MTCLEAAKLILKRKKCDINKPACIDCPANIEGNTRFCQVFGFGEDTDYHQMSETRLAWFREWLKDDDQ